MKHLLYILFSLFVFTACEEDKETVLPYPMDELDGTFWEVAKVETSYYDENWTLLKQEQRATDAYLYFKGNSVLYIVPDQSCEEGTYSISLVDQQFSRGKRIFSYELVEYNKSSFAYSRTHIPYRSQCSGAEYEEDVYWYQPAEPKRSYEEYIESYKRTGNYEHVDKY